MHTAPGLMYDPPPSGFLLGFPAEYKQVLPNDEREQERLDLLHHVFRLSLDGNLCRTKLENPQRVLDVGTGTGIWAIESELPPVFPITCFEDRIHGPDSKFI